MTSARHCILASRSPRRRALLAQLIPESRIEVLPPLDESEDAVPDGLTADRLASVLQSIARAKAADVRNQLQERDDWTVLIAADTLVIVPQAGGGLKTLGKPPERDWQRTVEDWFRSFYWDREHQVATAVCLMTRDGPSHEFCEWTTVRGRTPDPELLEWYLSTGESLGKAGGYGIQERGEMCFDSVQGSLSNVIGLPLFAVWKQLRVLAPELLSGLSTSD